MNNELDFLEMLLASALLPAAIAETTQQLRVHDILVTQFVHSGLLISNIVQKASVRRNIIISIEMFPLLLKIYFTFECMVRFLLYYVVCFTLYNKWK